ncbi:uncharacterized protein LOC107460120 [Arachis duranensis]|uniref:Uncharacterized protein LOC107460120 n=1 Tax=Arachis duranensis TaxID=130453 RepID=A0A6P4B8S9_ARADU|nr:uncharacterized protein LOC107460120 [Arachis duranensis]
MANNLGTTTIAYTLTEGESNNRPPFFNGKKYAYWKEKMRIFIQSIDYNIWKIVVSGPKIPTKTSANGVVTPKEETKWNDDDKKKVELNAKAINLFHCAISFEKYRKDGESIDEVFDRFLIIINNLDTLGTTYSEQTLVRKLLRSLTKKWETKATVLAENNNLSPITYNDLRGKLLAYETTNTNQDSKKKRTALKSRVESKESESSDNFSDNDELVFFSRRLKRLIRNKGKHKDSTSKEYKKDMSKVICHHCKEAGHLKYNCQKLKKEDKGKKKKRVLMASWEDLESDLEEEEDSECEAQICYMASEDQLDEVNYDDLSVDDLHVIIDDLTLNSEKLLNKYNKCKSENEMLKAENDFSKEKVKESKCALDIIEENRFLKYELEKLKGKHIICLASKNKKDMWYLDSGCSRHMIGRLTFFIKLNKYDGGFVTFGDDGKGNQVKKDDKKAQNHESGGNHESTSSLSPLVTESASKSTRPREWIFLKNYLQEFVIGDVSQGVKTRSSTRKANEETNIAFLSQMEPQNVKEALDDPSWVKAMEDELHEFEKNQVWTLVPKPNGKKVTGTK